MILSIVLFLLPAATRLFLSYDQSSADPYSFHAELFPLIFVCLPHWEMLLKEILWEYGNKARYSPRQTESFLQTEHETADTLWWGKHATERGEGKEITPHLDSAVLIS